MRQVGGVSVYAASEDTLSTVFLSASEPPSSSKNNDNVGNELDLRIASIRVLQSTGRHHYGSGFCSDGHKPDIYGMLP